MIRALLLLFLSALPALAQKNMYEAKVVNREPWTSEGNGGGDLSNTFLFQAINQQQACLYGPAHLMDGWDILPGGSICVKGGHGNLHFADFGTGPFFIDDEGYVFQSPIRYTTPRAVVRDFENGVH